MKTSLLFPVPVQSRCLASIVIPARNEEAALPATLTRLCDQRSLKGVPLPHEEYEVLLLLNNCTDQSMAVAQSFQRSQPDFALHIAECALQPDQSHVGTARSMLMDAAYTRMQGAPAGLALLSTDADTLVAHDWVAANLQEIRSGAEVVGGAIELFPEDFAALEPGVRRAYERDRHYQALVAELESLLDPDPCDPWPRHLQHFGASLACTCEVYRRAGGMKPVKPLEDVVFVDALRRVDARIRHSPNVSIATSARLEGRAEIGLSGQLRHWARDVATGALHDVDSAAWLVHRFRSMAALREMNAACVMPPCTVFERYRSELEPILREGLGVAAFLERIDCNRVIEATFSADRRDEITCVIEKLTAACDAARTARHG